VARVWNVSTGEIVAVLQGVQWGNATRYDVSDSSLQTIKHGLVRRWIATASTDQTARIWDASTGALVAQVTGHKGRVSDVAFTRDAKHVVSVSADLAQVFECDACVEDVVALARSRVSRSLTNEEREKYLNK
jgi:WD40 repeat protein